MIETGRIPELEEAADRLAVQDVLTKHCRGVDRADVELLKTAYWEDAEVAYGSFNGPAHLFCESLSTAIRKYQATQHRVTNISVDFNRDDAVVESYVTAYHYCAADAPDMEMTYLGRYVDHMQKRGNCWKIKFRRVVMDWNQNFTASAVLEGPPFAGLARGARAPNDPLYEMQNAILD